MDIFITNVKGKSFSIDEYKQFMYDERNEYCCESCPENRGFDNNCNHPCGQQNCWVTCHCYRG